MTNVRPVDLPELRAETAEHMAADGMSWFFEGRAKGSVYRNWSPTHLKDLEVEQLRKADLYFIAQPMTLLALEAAKTLPPFLITPEDVPSQAGFAYLGEGAFQAVDAVRPAAAFGWSMGDGGVTFSLYGDTDFVVNSLLESGGCTAKQAAEHRTLVGRLTPMLFEARIPYGVASGQGELDPKQEDLLIRSFRSMWLLMQQPLAQIDVVEPDRAARKRLSRAGQEPKPVRVIELRRPKSSGEQGDSSREYHHQWIVKGHWRQHWYPKRQVHRPVWIAPHVKGPEGAPMIGGEKVYAWKR